MGTVLCSSHLGVCVCLPLVRGGVCLWSRGVSAFGLRGCLPLVRGEGGCLALVPGECLPPFPGECTPLGQTPSGQTPPGIHSPPSVCWDTSPYPVHTGIHTKPAKCMLGYIPPWTECKTLVKTLPFHNGTVVADGNNSTNANRRLICIQTIGVNELMNT